MPKQHDSGRAFPSKERAFPSKEFVGGNTDTVDWPGMTLRDYFAGQAIKGAVLIGLAPNQEPEWFAEQARVAYLLADVMLAERQKG